MKITKEDNVALHKEVVARPRCENHRCRAVNQDGLDPAHVFGDGAGGSFLRCNILGLCRRCHWSSHANQRPSTDELLLTLCRREQVSPDVIEEVWWFIANRLDKHDSQERIKDKLSSLSNSALLLARRELVESGKLAP